MPEITEVPEPQKSDASRAKAPGAAVSTRAGKVIADVSPTELPTTYTATAYSLRGRTASGRMVSRGLIAADRRVLPLGTRVRLQAGSYSGEYLVADTGGAVRGRLIDIWMPSTSEAMRFGRRPIKLTVLSRVRPRVTAPRRRR
ncbi:MAG: 3D domain-containing protein [Acidobacteria bacterium]|nr:3D domain-containing protein [Acidobacteriota bacterium]